MQKIFKSVLSFCLAVAVCLGTAAIFGVTQYKVADADTVSTYYSKITASGGTQLLGQLHDLIVETHKTYTSYDDCKGTKVNQTDPGPGGVGVMDFYTQTSVTKFSGTIGTWNREHVWCQSLSNGLWGTSGGGSDMHHIRPSESQLNGNRSSKKYGTASSHSSSNEEWSYNTSGGKVALGGYSSGNTFEPLDKVKGDVARIVMYVYTHYNNASNVGGTKESGGKHGNLPYTNIMTASNEAAAIKLLLEWNKLDPVDQIEMTRNEAVYAIQGNRNPFIDNSSYAEAIWGNGSVIDPGPGIDPNPGPSDTLKSISLSATSLNLAIGETYNLTVTPNPANASASVIWSSSDSSVATVTNGQIVANAAGTATITATSAVNTSIKATATVKVIKSSSSETGVSKVTIKRDSFTDASGGYAFQTWKANGLEGTAYIYGGEEGSMQFNNNKGKTCYYIASTTAPTGAITSVTAKSPGGKTDRDWKLLTSTTPYGEGTANPTDGKDHGTKTVTTTGVTWNISGNDKYFALVYIPPEGKEGAAYLDSVVVEYGTGTSSGTPAELQELLINPAQFELKEGASTKLTVVSVPSTASAEVTWASSDTSVATVSADGTVTAIKAGTATITATSTTNSSIKATATVTVTDTPFVTTNERAQAFHDAVTAIKDDGTLKVWRTTVNAAINAYKNLSEADKTEVSADIVKLNAAIASYNAKIKAYNDADEAALKGAGVFI